jgi:hypothetical protein
MDEITAAQLMLGYSGFLTLLYGLVARKLNQMAISRLSKLEKQIEDEVSYLDSFRDMKHTEKYTVLSVSLNHIRRLNYKKRFMPVSGGEVAVLEETCMKYCRR